MANGNFGGGSGIVDDPYLIEDAEDLVAIKNVTSPELPYFLQTTDIDLSGYNNWEPIVTATSYYGFSGRYNGNNKKIKNLKYKGNKIKFALFYGHSVSMYENITLENIDIEYINEEYVSFVEYAGLVVNNANANITNCHVRGKITNASERVIYAMGGIVSTGSANIKKCSFEGEISGRTSNGKGGIVGISPASINIENCYSITSAEEAALIGYMDSFNSNRNIRNCYAVNGRIAGEFKYNTTYDNTRVVNSYFDERVSNNSYGTPKSLTQLKRKDTFTNWDFDSEYELSWTMKEGIDYPKFLKLINVELVYLNSIKQPTHKGYWNENISINGFSLFFFNHVDMRSKTRTIVYIPYQSVVEINIKIIGRLGFEKINRTENVSANSQVIITSQLYDFANQQTYYLRTPQDFLEMTDEFGRYVVMNDIDFAGFDYVIPFNDNNFLGNFDGNGKTLENLTIQNVEDYWGDGYGLLGHIINATIENVIIKNSKVTDAKGPLYSPKGLLVGKMEQVILDELQPAKNRLIQLRNCKSIDNSFAFDSGTYTLGVFVGEVSVKESVLEALDVTDYTMFKAIRSHNTLCSQKGGGTFGGLVGTINIESDKLLNVASDVELYTTFDFNDTDAVMIGGLFGQATSGNAVFKKVGTNTVLKNIMPLNFGFGGLFGQINFKEIARFVDWYTDSVVENVTVNSGLGGIAGVWSQPNATEITINKGYIATSTEIETSADQGLGLFWGYTDMNISPTMTDVFVDAEVNTMVEQDGTSDIFKTTAEMKNKDTFTNFDFEKVWVMPPGNYPKFELLTKRVVKLCKRMKMIRFRKEQ